MCKMDIFSISDYLKGRKLNLRILFKKQVLVLTQRVSGELSAKLSCPAKLGAQYREIIMPSQAD